ncbi:uncharacterized protein LOC132035021 [Lycium ferocissimum]|uniref:uncharacterized protein LOC132035021 n=1 Tax=Lycium ferocissimum TaxID=112874 RepID=UPI002814EFA5|nr:uncharacterized protein LOC132035021 [Lycium ferocissimum]
MWHRRLGHASFSLLNKLVAKDLVQFVGCQMSSLKISRSLLEKTPYELLNGRKPKLTYLRAFGCKCFVHNNGKETLEKFDAKSDEGIFLGYSSHSKAYKVCNKRTQCVEESVHVIFDESNELGDKGTHDDEDVDGEFSKAPDKTIEISNGNTELIGQVKQGNKRDGVESP